MIGEAAVELGGGRAQKGDPIDYAVGIVVHHKVGDYVEVETPLFSIYANDENRLREARKQVLAAHVWSETPVEALPLFYGVVR